jgi:hypothetical protein
MAKVRVSSCNIVLCAIWLEVDTMASVASNLELTWKIMDG